MRTLIPILVCVALLAVPTTALAQCFGQQLVVQDSFGNVQLLQVPTVAQVPAFTFQPAFVPVQSFAAPSVSVRAPFTRVNVNGFSGAGSVFVRSGLFGRRVVDVRF